MGAKGRRSLYVGAALVGLVAIVGLASRARTPGGGGGPTRTVSTDILFEYVLLLAGVAALVVVPFSIYAFISGRGDKPVALPPRRNWMLALFFTMAAFAGVSVILLGIHFFEHHVGQTSKNPLSPFAAPGQGRSGGPHPIRFDWLPVIVVLSLAGAGAAAGAVLLLRHRRRSRPTRSPAEAFALALDESLDDLLAEPDPRRAVILAYARMEQSLARSGLPRDSAEAPREYLQRALTELGAGHDSIERLTALFERAKFSEHTIDLAMKDEAVAALRALRDELRGTG
jgi:hypothetical protein